MATPVYQYKETRLNLEPSSSSYVVDIELPTTGPQGRSQRQGVKSAKSTAKIDASRASTSAIYYRKHHNFPKGFLWRVLEEDTILSIRAIDIYKPKKAPDANLILNFHFPRPIIPTCIALCDPSDHDALSIFVVDTANQLYSLFLRPDSFRKRSFVETGLGDSFKIYQPHAFRNFKHPYRLIAVNNEQLVATLSDGGHLRLDKNISHNAAQAPWKETFYNAKGWFRSLLGGSGTMDIKAAAAAVQTDLGTNNTASLLFTVCLDHHLRIWNLFSGQILEVMDLLNAPRDPQETGKWQLEATQTNLIRFMGVAGGKGTCITYSPIGAGEFKFWTMATNDGSRIAITDMYPNDHLVPVPPLGSDVWTLADFSVSERPGTRESRIWLLWKNNMAYRVQELASEAPDLATNWKHGWRTVFSDTVTPTAQESGPSDPIDPTEKWLQLILFPGRFPKANIEAALSAYEGAIGRKSSASSRNSQGLAESICAAIASTSSLNKTSSGDVDHEQFRNSSEMQWRKFYRILLELDKPRGEALALSYEPESGMPWVVCADNISAIRACGELEQIVHNPQVDFEGSKSVPTLVTTGINFAEGFSESMLQSCHSVFRPEMFEESSKSDQERLQFVLDKTGLWRQVTEEEAAPVTDALGANFELVTTRLYDEVLASFDETWYSQHAIELPLTEFGRKIIVRGVQDLAELYWNICFSHLILIVHMEFEYDDEKDALHNRVEVGVIYRNLLVILKRLELVRWLANTQLMTPLPKADRTSSATNSSPAGPKRQVEEHRPITALEGNVGHLLGLPDLQTITPGTMPSIITRIVADLCAPTSNVELEPQFIQCGLLVRDRADLATELTPFCDQDPFSTYVQGRVRLALKDFTTAATYFKKAAYGMSVPQANVEKHSSGLLDDTEWNLLYAGLPRYYAHIVALFEQQKAYSSVIEFARLALQFVNSKTDDADKVRTELQCRLFSGAISTSQFELAHSTVVGIRDRALQHSCLRALIQRMCDNLHNSELVGLTFPGLQGAVDDILAQYCQDTIDVITGVPYHQILYAWRIKRNDYRGAAVVLLDRIQKLRQLGEGDQVTGDDILDTAVTRQYLMLINVLSCVDPKQAWITIKGPAGPVRPGTGNPDIAKRKVVTLADIRKEYQDELDRIAAIHNDQFGFTADDEMEIL